MRRNAQVVSLLALIVDFMAAALPSNSSTASLRANSRNHLHSSQPPVAASGNELHQLLNTTLFPADLSRIDTPMRTARPARRARQNEEVRDDEPAADEPIQRALLPKEGVAQAKRAARHVQRKMELLTGRVNQIQSQIAEDHPTGSSGSGNLSSSLSGSSGSGSNQGQYTSDFSTPYNGDGLDMAAEISANQYESNSDKLLDGGSTSAPPAVASIGPDAQNESLSAHMADGDEYEQRLSGAGNLLRAAANESRWSQQVIKSVVPTILQHQQQQQQQADEQQGSSTERAMVDTRDPDQQPEEPADGEQSQPKPQEYQTPVTVESDQQVSAAQTPISANRTRLASGLLDNQALPSMVGPDWAPNENHNFFQELNYKNHAKPAVLAESRAEEGVGFPSSQPSQARHSRFQNMTVVNNEQDLANSFSNQQHQVAGGSSSTRRPEQQVVAAAAAPSSSAPKKTSTYSYSVYGRNAKDQQARASTTTAIPAPVDPYDLGYPNDYPTVRSNKSESSASRNYQQPGGQTEPPVVWPTFASSGASGTMPDEGVYSGSRLSSGRDPESASAAQNEMAPEEKRKYSNLINTSPAASAGDHQLTRAPSSGYQSNEYNYSGGGGGGARTHRHDSSRDQVRSSGHMLPRDDLLSHSMPGNLSSSSSSSNGNIGQEGTGLKHRSSSNADESPLMSYSPNQDTSTYSGVGSSAADQYSASGSTSGGYAAADGAADYPASDTPTYQQMRPATGSSSPSYLSASSSSGTQMLGDRNSLFTLPNDLSGAALERALSNYGYQLAGRQPNQDADGSGVTGDPTGGRSSLLPGGADSGSDSGSEQQQQQQQLAQLQQQNYEAQLLQAMRNMNQQQQQQYLSSPTRTSNQIAESMLPAATSTNNRLQRQKQLNQMVNSIVSQQTPASALSSLDINQLLQQFKEQQQQQRLLAAAQQQQQQQQQLQQQVSSSADNQLSFYSGGANQRDSSPNVIYRRYSPEVNYLSTRNSPSSQQQQFMASLATGDSSPGGDFGAFSTASQFQPVYSATGLEENSRALRNANLAHYRASLAAAKAALSAPYHTGASTGGAGGTSTLANNYNAANQLGQLYATAAVNSPAFYDAPSAAQQSQQQQQVQAQHRLTSSTDSSQQSSAGSAVAGKRSYLNSLFKPTASSRYYYAPTYLSPLSLPSGLHSIYAPAGLTGAETLQTLPQMYATSAASPYLTAGSALDPAAQQYQAFAAANGLQAHYMDPEMAESSMVPTDSGAGSSFSADSSGGGQATGGSIAHSGNSDTETNQSSSKSSKSATPWTNIAGLLLGILPFGILMASLLPAVSVAGRKKRELELSGRNFSELLKWRAPSKVLGALMDLNRQPVEQGRAFGKAAALINGQLAQLVAPQSKRSQQQQQASSSQATSTYSKRRSLARPSQVNPPDDRFASSSGGGSNPPSDNLVYSVALNEAANNTASESDSPDLTSSTPPSAHTGNGPANGTGVKAKVRKAISALNNFIAAAQNIKRKHRSSLTDNQWSIPAMLRNSLKLDNLFNINEFRRQMSSVEQTRQLVAEHQLRQLQQQQQQIQQQQQQQQQVQQVQQQQPQQQQQQQSQSSDTRVEDQTAAPEQPAQSNNQQMEQVLQAPAVVSISVSNDDEPITHTYTATAAELPLPQNREALTTQVNQSTLAVSVPVNSVAKSGSLLERASELGNSTRNHLALCVNQFLCRLALRLNTVLRNSTTSTSMPSLIDASGKMRANETQALQEQHVEQLTKKYINQVVEQIEAKKVSVPLGLRSAQPGAPEEPLMAPEELNVLYKNAMTNQCRAMYACSELVQFERTLAKMTNLKVGRHLMQPVVAS